MSRKGKYLAGTLFVVFVAAICAAFSMADSDEFNIARREILLRKIAHELLLQSGDSTSRVLPIKNIAENEYQIRFEHAFSFQADSLVNTTRRVLAKDPDANHYVVTVLNSGESGIAYGYAISNNKKDDIVTCVGRKQPQAHYLINIKFKSTVIHTIKDKYLLGGLPLLAFIGFVFLSSVKGRRVVPEIQHDGIFTLGAMLFDAKNRKLMINGNTIVLTGTESRVLNIFASSPNQTIERSRLQKEIWEDEGVIVGRSLDMFISKLRKKLEPEPGVNLVVVRAKGYKLEITAV
ncbi:winged helix-turn-helix domain-containing protein [Pedobacter rhizosphaerae]|nr:winged helix-turn-helix domain-containing protein [Pedobacter rhizosphaerae]